MKYIVGLLFVITIMQDVRIYRLNRNKGKYRMSDLWAYHDNCEGDYCPMNCDRCPKAEEVFEDDDQDFS